MKKPVVKFISADGVLSGGEGESKPMNGNIKGFESSKTVWVFRRIHLQVANQFRSDPTGARLEAREIMLIEDQTVHTVLFQTPGAG